jgi:hypothetical protein
MPTKTKRSKKKQTKPITRRKIMAQKKAVKTLARARKKAVAKKRSKPKGQAREKHQTPEPSSFSLNRRATRSGRQAGDLQGVPGSEGADSESVAELIEEGNPFEAGVVLGVERPEADEKEVRTREVPEDDVPDEYLDKD